MTEIEHNGHTYSYHGHDGVAYCHVDGRLYAYGATGDVAGAMMTLPLVAVLKLSIGVLKDEILG